LKIQPLFGVVLLTLTIAGPVLAFPGIPDRVPAASLLVPFFETGINVATHPHDTLMVVTNTSMETVTFHYQVWDIDGYATILGGNVTLSRMQSWSAAMRDLIAGSRGRPPAQEQLTQGDFYRGFVTVDAVTASTFLTPRESGFPFSSANVLEGYIYYTRLSQGSASGLPMVALEAVPSYPQSIHDFYKQGRREEMDYDARVCGATISCIAGAGLQRFDRIDLRHFGSSRLNGRSRLVVFAWDTSRGGLGPSRLCEVLGCSAWYDLNRYDEAGNQLGYGVVRLDHVVNVLEVDAPESGWLSLSNLPSVDHDLQVFAFSFNAASPAGNPNLTWDALFEATVLVSAPRSSRGD
jgi:hypothetical protein